MFGNLRQIRGFKNLFVSNGQERNLLLDVISITILNSIARVTGYCVPLLIANWFGVSKETDVFFFAYGLILFFTGIFSPIMESLIIPYIAEVKAKNEDVGKFVSNVLNVSFLFFSVLTIVFILSVKPFLSLIINFDSYSLNLFHFIFIEIAPLTIFTILSSILVGALNSFKKFFISIISLFFRSTVNIVFIFLLKGICGVHSIAIGYVIGEIFRFLILAIIINKMNLFRLTIYLKLDSKLLEFSKISFYQIAGMIAVGLNPLIDKVMASYLGEGSISILYYADRLYMIPVSFLITGLTIPFLSDWSEKYYQYNSRRLHNDIKKVVSKVFIFALSLAVFLSLFRHPIVSLLLGKAVSGSSKELIEFVLIGYLLGLVPFTAGFPLSRAHMVIKNTKFLAVVLISNFFAKVALNFIFIHFLGLFGLALSTSLVSWFSFVLLWEGIRRKKA
ncbi:MAG: lipid II flippase MurJ [Candidatus Aenigmatarchaeota archaeon]